LSFLYEDVVIPIYQEYPDGLDLQGSAVLVKSISAFWLFTAAHVVGPDLRLWLPGRPFSMLNEPVRMCNDPLDLAYVRLQARTVMALQTIGLVFLPIDCVDPSNESFFPGRCIFSGYPVHRTKVDNVRGIASATPIELTSDFLSDAELRRRRYDTKVHLAARLKHLRDASGPVPSFDPCGLSGGALWRASKLGKQTLVGIVTEYSRKKKVLSGTRIRPLIVDIVRTMERNDFGIEASAEPV
jgi:hypothetical protein